MFAFQHKPKVISHSDNTNHPMDEVNDLILKSAGERRKGMFCPFFFLSQFRNAAGNCLLLIDAEREERACQMAD